ncbi:hypothetical protein DFH11DRAFT_1586534 [Phellopilus nigrolimitatus]|nr:hypothetical protein DFH11DRAFT_1586534 [Phellopilus nigrolimitatus]
MTRPLSLLCLLGCLRMSDVFLTDVTDVLATMFCAHAPARMTMDLLEVKLQVIALRTATAAARTTAVVNVETTARPAIKVAMMTATPLNVMAKML